MRIYFFLICILSAGLGLYGQVPVRITSDKALYSITQDHIQYLEDKKARYLLTKWQLPHF
ncbi:hypothetical protein LWM68_41700 [Niabella sp. W65]|nr:hypothetical protein [Niabella sp. W65]MCH7368682.1 hypothetical protein [Niabella sp. W65]ULT44255.1 hypothetical protein KRR40_13390 [Niabella sp. I65]